MKRLVVIALALFTINGMAQEKRKRSSEGHEKMELRKEMTPKDIADLKTKKLVLRLDLTDIQQQKIHKIILNQSEKSQSLRKEHKADGDKIEKLSKDEYVKMQNHRLDQQIEMKQEMKTILTPEQYSKFEKIEPRKHRKKGKRRKKQ